MKASDITFVLVGPHGAGKTTVGTLLARELGVPFHHELGRELASDPALRDVRASAASRQEAFDERVFTEELARDLENAGKGRVVETWHPGNLAYAARRSPRVAAAYLSAVREACTVNVVVIPVMALPRVLEQRKTEPGDAKFFMDVGRDAASWARGLGLRVVRFLNTTCGDSRLVLAAARERIGALGIELPARLPERAVEVC